MNQGFPPETAGTNIYDPYLGPAPMTLAQKFDLYAASWGTSGWSARVVRTDTIEGLGEHYWQYYHSQRQLEDDYYWIGVTQDKGSAMDAAGAGPPPPLKLTRELAINILWGEIESLISYAALERRFDVAMKDRPKASVQSIMFDILRHLTGNSNKRRQIVIRLLSRLEPYGITKESRPFYEHPYALFEQLRQILLDAGVANHHGGVSDAIYWSLVHYWKAHQDWVQDRIVWQVLRDFCGPREKVYAAWNAWRKKMEQYAEDDEVAPFSPPELLTRDLALEACRNILLTAKIDLYSENRLAKILDRRITDGENWYQIMLVTLQECCRTLEQLDLCHVGLDAQFKERFDQRQQVLRKPEYLSQGAFGPKIYPGCAAVQKKNLVEELSETREEFLFTARPLPVTVTKKKDTIAEVGNPYDKRNTTKFNLPEDKISKSLYMRDIMEELANMEVLNAFNKDYRLARLTEWDKLALLEILVKDRPVVADAFARNVAQLLVNNKYEASAHTLGQMAEHPSILAKDKIWQALEFLTKTVELTLFDLVQIIPYQCNMKPIEEFLRRIHLGTPTSAKTIGVEVKYILLDEPKILEVKISEEGLKKMIDTTAAAGAVSNPLINAMQTRGTFKHMTAISLLTQTSNPELEREVQALYLALGRNGAWRTFAELKGATTGAAAELHIAKAVRSGKPERLIIPDIAMFPGYMASEFINDLKAIRVQDVTTCVDKILLILTSNENDVIRKATAKGELNARIRAWLEDGGLCAPGEVQYRLDALLAFGVSSWDDLTLMQYEDFVGCGFTGLYARKAAHAVANPKK